MGAPFDRAVLAQVAAHAGTRSEEIESQRRLPSDLVERMIAAGAFRTCVPVAYGGTERPVLDTLDTIEAFSYHDGSAGWCVMIGNTTGLVAGFLPPVHARELFGDPAAIGGGYAQPAGTATVVEGGGLRVTGRWSWGSGTDHCTAIGGGVRVLAADGTATTVPGGGPFPYVFFDRADVELLDTWHVHGLKGTASTDYEVHDAFVPEGRWADLTALNRTTPAVDTPLYRFPFFGTFALSVAAVLAGLGRRAVDELVAIGGKLPMGSTRTLAERPVVQAQIARAEADVRSSRAFVREVVEETWAAAVEGAVTDEHRRLLRLAAATMAERCWHAVELCYRAAGGTSVYDTSPLQRLFRDASVATQHGMVAERTLEPVGLLRFGRRADTSML